jgi:hypothetical protein
MSHASPMRAAAWLAMLAATGSAAQPNPYYVGAAQGVTRESNVFRVADGLPKSADTLSTTSLLAGLDQPVGRQRLFADAAARYNRYRTNSQLDHTGYGLAAGLDWETVAALSGRVSYTVNQGLARYGADQGPALTARNLERSQELLARGQLGLDSLLSLQASWVRRRLDYSAVQFNFQEFDQDSGSLGVRVRPSDLLTLGAAARRTKGRYPFAVETAAGVFQRDDFRRDDIDLSADWVATGQSTLKGRLSYTKESHDALASRDISGGTGALSWAYRPTAKLSFDTELARDTGSESSFSRASQISASSVGSNSRLSDTASLRVRYEATAKIQVDMLARQVRRHLVNTFALASGAASTDAGTDRLTELKLGVSYAPTRAILLACAHGREKRDASSSVSYPYAAHVSSCSVQLKLQ